MENFRQAGVKIAKKNSKERRKQGVCIATRLTGVELGLKDGSGLETGMERVKKRFEPVHWPI
jgi:hypothetical protein